ncbi:hypothetical protein [Nostoc edaphicum]|nr:hypothetical protein [Nostoc edaphicum]
MVAITLQKLHLLYDYLVVLGFGEHFFSFRHEVKVQLETQEASYRLSPVS